ncbi:MULTISPECIES: sodium:proton antiporter [unclassified Desulfovibrio]|uniref:sodium:proton antiporter n=1 Tax=unclassified Desulfovibrio TaxID=2593640 RepID=UPI000F5E4D07|nr:MULTISPECIES: sodium:proton antiporter [unclassified Desulfovibrio]RRD69648.1 sodium:proton antiporter [Desulfovibrio sp. OH1209_COT-279]RRD86295.1 sodium:proton antiporter [Desulfovibrio sp. OH1186_COT-070]
MKKLQAVLAAFLATALLPCVALAAEGHPSIPGATLPVYWVIPFVCMLLSIAIMPLATPHFWEHHFGKISVFWGLAFLVPCLVVFGFNVALYEFLHIILLDYIPFIVLLFSLFTVAGGVRLTGTLVGTPTVNTGLLAVGTVLASWMGTTGAAMLLIRPLLRANAHRKYRMHSVVFFIFLVANIGGSLTPLGDPPLFLGFLKGVTFFWTTSYLFVKTLILSVALLTIYLILDNILFRKEGSPTPPQKPDAAGEKLGLDGKINLLLLLGVVLAVLLSGLYPLGVLLEVFGIPIEGQNLLRDLALLGIAGLSLKLTSTRCRELNDFSWAPIQEVAKLFFGIFLSMIPAIAILRAGTEGALAPLIQMVSQDGQPVNTMYFWLTGMLSSFLDNAPTYLVFFNTAGGDAQHLMYDIPTTLTAISAGAVFMGANTYIGNAPNFMVRSIAENQGVRMPSFFGYMLWSGGILIPLFVLLTWLFFI